MHGGALEAPGEPAEATYIRHFAIVSFVTLCHLPSRGRPRDLAVRERVSEELFTHSMHGPTRRVAVKHRI